MLPTHVSEGPSPRRLAKKTQRIIGSTLKVPLFQREQPSHFEEYKGPRRATRGVEFEKFTDLGELISKRHYRSFFAR